MWSRLGWLALVALLPLGVYEGLTRSGLTPPLVLLMAALIGLVLAVVLARLDGLGWRELMRLMNALAAQEAGSASGTWPPDAQQQALKDGLSAHSAPGQIAARCHALLERGRTQQRALRGELHLLRLTLDAIGDGVIVVDLHGRVLRVNPVATILLGRPKRDLIQTEASACLPLGQDRTATTPDRLQAALRGEENAFFDGEVVFEGLAGKRRRIQINAGPIRETQGERLGNVIVMRDITEREELEEQLRQSQKMQGVGQLAGGIAHDFNNMLAGILGLADLMRERFAEEGDEEALRQLDGIIDAAERAAELTQSLLIFARKAQVEREPMDMHAAIADAVILLKRSIDPRVKVEVRCQAAHATVMGNYNQLENLILNLGLNARDAMPDGGTITIITSEVSLTGTETSSSVFGLGPGSHLRIVVRDSGCGMSQGVLERLFEPFFTTKPIGEGTGLGLAMVYGTVTDHQGAVHVSSIEGRGSDFVLHLPLLDSNVKQYKRQRSDTVHRGEGTVLIADDEAIVRKTARSMLLKLGYEVIEAENGDEAVEIYQTRGADIDLVLLDLLMPERDGAETFRALRALDAQVRVVIASGFDRNNNVDELLDEGAAGFLHKPYRFAPFSRCIAEALLRL